ncbi:hypothetical protein PTKIN_Ptkin14bG0216500 [Pterospermum kingtungense]
MAFTRLSLPFSLLVLSTLLVIAFAGDYGTNDSSKYGYDGIPADSPQAKPEYGDSKPNGEEKPNYGDKPTTYKPNSGEKSGYGNKPEGEEKTKYGSKPEGENKPNYGTKQYNYKPKEEGKEKSGYENKPYVVKSKPEEEEKPKYGTNQYNYKPKEEEKEKSAYENNRPYVVKSKPEGEEKPYSIAVEGFVYCKTPSSHYAIPRALAKVTCKAVDEVGVEKTVPICSVPTDAKGYFYATVSSANKSLKLKDCKAFLESSPEKNCNVPTDVNKGITGFPLCGDVYRVLNDKHTKLYSAQPFFYTPYESKSVPNGY